MPAILLFLSGWWKEIAIVLLVGGLVFYVYEKGVTDGKLDCEQAHVLIDQQRDKALNGKIDALAKGSIEIANTNKTTAGVIGRKIDALAHKNLGPVVVYKDGKCLPTESYVNTYNAINEAANAKDKK